MTRAEIKPGEIILMQEYDTVKLHEMAELICEACDDQILSAKVLKRLIETTVVFHQATSALEGEPGMLVKFNWLPVTFYLAETVVGQIVEYDGFKIAVWGSGLGQEVEFFFPQNVSIFEYGVFERAQLGGYRGRCLNKQMNPVESFHLTPEERTVLEDYIANPPVTTARLRELSVCILKITQRTKPLYEAGNGMALASLALIDRAVGVLAEVEDALLEQQNTVGEVKANLLSLHNGNETKH